jgi:uncharacterized damage-inducible protein DinB
MHPQSICAGTDTFGKIGDPEGANMRHNVSIEQIWIEQIAQNFPRTQGEDSQAQGLAKIQKYAEEKIDKMRVKKDQELEEYRKEIERAKRFERSKLLQQANARQGAM